MVISYGRFGTTYRSHPQRSRFFKFSATLRWKSEITHLNILLVTPLNSAHWNPNICPRSWCPHFSGTTKNKKDWNFSWPSVKELEKNPTLLNFIIINKGVMGTPMWLGIGTTKLPIDHKLVVSTTANKDVSSKIKIKKKKKSEHEKQKCASTIWYFR